MECIYQCCRSQIPSDYANSDGSDFWYDPASFQCILGTHGSGDCSRPAYRNDFDVAGSSDYVCGLV